MEARADQGGGGGLLGTAKSEGHPRKKHQPKTQPQTQTQAKRTSMDRKVADRGVSKLRHIRRHVPPQDALLERRRRRLPVLPPRHDAGGDRGEAVLEGGAGVLDDVAAQEAAQVGARRVCGGDEGGVVVRAVEKAGAVKSNSQQPCPPQCKQTHTPLTPVASGCQAMQA